MEIEDFNREVRERQVGKFHAAMDRAALNELYSLHKLESAFTRETVPSLYVDVITNGFPRNLVDIQRKSYKSTLAVVADNFRRGATIRVSDLQKFDERLERFVREVQRYFAARSQINLYLTPPSKTGFAPHFDITDVFVVQCAGRKEWKIFHSYTDKTELPLLDILWEPDRYKPSGSTEVITLPDYALSSAIKAWYKTGT